MYILMLTPVVYENSNMTVIFAPHQPSDPIFVDNIGWHKTPVGHFYGPAVRPYYLLHLIVNGKGEVERNGEITRLGAGDAFLIQPNEITTYRADKHEPWEYFWIAFDGDFAPTLLSRTTDRLFAAYRKSGLLALQTAVNNHETDALELLKTLLTILTSIQTVGLKMDKETDAVANAIEYMERNYFQTIEVASLARSFGYSRAHFSTLFAKRTGVAPHQFLTKTRIENAKKLLRETSFSMEEIAFSIGFSSAQQFCSHFKTLTGLTPLQFRKNIIT